MEPKVCAAVPSEDKHLREEACLNAVRCATLLEIHCHRNRHYLPDWWLCEAHGCLFEELLSIRWSFWNPEPSEPHELPSRRSLDLHHPKLHLCHWNLRGKLSLRLLRSIRHAKRQVEADRWYARPSHGHQSLRVQKQLHFCIRWTSRLKANCRYHRVLWHLTKCLAGDRGSQSRQVPVGSLLHGTGPSDHWQRDSFVRWQECFDFPYFQRLLRIRCRKNGDSWERQLGESLQLHEHASGVQPQLVRLWKWYLRAPVQHPWAIVVGHSQIQCRSAQGLNPSQHSIYGGWQLWINYLETQIAVMSVIRQFHEGINKWMKGESAF